MGVLLLPLDDTPPSLDKYESTLLFLVLIDKLKSEMLWSQMRCRTFAGDAVLPPLLRAEESARWTQNIVQHQQCCSRLLTGGESLRATLSIYQSILVPAHTYSQLSSGKSEITDRTGLRFSREDINGNANMITFKSSQRTKSIFIHFHIFNLGLNRYKL